MVVLFLEYSQTAEPITEGVVRTITLFLSTATQLIFRSLEDILFRARFFLKEAVFYSVSCKFEP